MKPSGTLRIIAGEYRSRKISVPSVMGVRPTTDRVRETLFNWLMPYVVNSHCLDLFAGSGILGFEALSRGAKQVLFIDENTKVIEQLHTTALQLGVKNFYIQRLTLPQLVLEWPFSPFNIIFCDPPYQPQQANFYIEWILKNVPLQNNALIYVEYSRQALLTLPPSLTLYRQLSTKHIQASLLQYHIS